MQGRCLATPVLGHPRDKLPEADQDGPLPVDRKQGLKDTAVAEEQLRAAKRARAAHDDTAK